MFGFVTAHLGKLSEEQAARYRQCYCGLCHSLKERHGELSRFTLTYDMTFLVLILSSLYEPEETENEAKCAPHPFKSQKYWQNEISDYAADMNVALAYLNCLDNWKDDWSVFSLGEAKLMEKSYNEICEKYPRQCTAMKESIEKLSALEESWTFDADAASACFGSLMAELFVYNDEDYWSGYLRRFGMALGQFIYIMDACIDLRDDKRYYKYNPMLHLFNRVDEKEQFKAILEMLMSDCVKAFEALPLLQDAELIQNILCFGVWTQYNKHYKITEGEGPNGTRSV